jgi:hypothetical protein
VRSLLAVAWASDPFTALKLLANLRGVRFPELPRQLIGFDPDAYHLISSGRLTRELFDQMPLRTASTSTTSSMGTPGDKCMLMI